MSKHTPGPWEASDDVILCADPDMAIGSVFPCDRDKSAYRTGFTYGEVTKSNARLIAAAPELLKALQEMVEMREYAQRGLLHPYRHELDIVTDARVAIAKAAGETP